METFYCERKFNHLKQVIKIKKSNSSLHTEPHPAHMEVQSHGPGIPSGDRSG